MEQVGWWHAPAICGIESRCRHDAGMGGKMPSLSPLDSPAGHPPSFGILCVGIERVVGVTAQRPLACQRSSKGAPMPIPTLGSHAYPYLPRGSHAHPYLPIGSQAQSAIGGSQSLMPGRLSTQAAIPSTSILPPSTFPFNPCSRRICDLVPCYHCLPKL